MAHFEHEPVTAGLQRSTHSMVFSMTKVAVMVFLMVMTATFATVFGLQIWDAYFEIPDAVTVPAITGKELAEANKALEDKGLHLSIQESRHTNKHPDRHIISQDPVAGRKVRKGRQILAVVSLGPELVDVPELKGKTLREARILLSNSRLRVGKVSYKQEKYGEPEQVLEQRPSGGEKVAKGRPVDLTVQRGSSSASRLARPHFALGALMRRSSL